MLADLLDESIRAEPALARRLKLKGFVRHDIRAYGPIIQMEQAAIESGYPGLR
ncbi:hypothetical protein [Burkholderia cepacia]|uniref:hypothetical protein n=1 Tax=Burkholderia cepacia TaxID=292 RepID=UPI001F174E61|nr:hypothetical protein [Burkholderia cepacia]MCE4124495.1 hypothetical protein [Burkholderia cepacia]